MGSSPQSQLAKPTTSPKRRKLSYDSFVLLLAMVIALPSTAIAEVLLLTGNYSSELKWTLTLFLVLGWIIGGSILQGHVIRPLQTLANMVASIREEDFSFRVRGGDNNGIPDSYAERILDGRDGPLRRQIQAERAALALDAVHLDGTAHQVEVALDDGQP